MILLTKDKTRAKRPGLFLTKKCYPQKKHDTTANPIWPRKRNIRFAGSENAAF